MPRSFRRLFLALPALALLFLLMASPAPAPAQPKGPPSAKAYTTMNTAMQCEDRISCWYAHMDEINAAIEEGISFQYLALNGPPWDPCRFKYPGQKCIPLEVNYIAKTVITQKERDYTYEYECEFLGQGTGVLIYEDLSQEYQLNAALPAEYTKFTSCHGEGIGSDEPMHLTCSESAKDPVIIGIYYKKGKYDIPMATIGTTEPVGCTATWNDPGAHTPVFTDEEMPSMMPKELFDNIMAGYPGLTFSKEKNSDHFIRKDTGKLSIIFELVPDFFDKTTRPK